MTRYKLTYFNAMGRGEIPRLMFKTAGIEFEDFRIPDEQWPEFKKTIIHGQVPILEVDGKQMIQSLAICRYIAREAGFYGSSNWEASRIDSICETVGDYEHDIDRLWHQDETQETKAHLKKRYVEVKMPKIFGILETLLKENNTGDGFFVGEKGDLHRDPKSPGRGRMGNLFFRGNATEGTILKKTMQNWRNKLTKTHQISMADFVVFVFIDVTIRTHFTFDEPTGFPKLTTHLKRMKEVPQIKEWIEKRPKTPY